MNELQAEAAMVYEMSQVYGGSFEKAVCDSLNYADIYNIQKIKETWPEMWDKNLSFYKITQKKD